MAKIAVVEDDIYLRDEIINTFEKRGYSVSSISCFDNVEKQLIDINPDLVVLDVGLPGKSGYELCKSLKAKASFSILILTARDTLSDELTALGLGADDFLIKPCHPDRLIARSEKILHTYGKVKNIIEINSMSLDVSVYKLIWKNNTLLLPETEGKILKLLIERHPETVSKGEIFIAVWGTDEFIDENILQVNITRLRKNLSGIGLKDIIKTVRGQGYVLEVDQV